MNSDLIILWSPFATSGFTLTASMRASSPSFLWSVLRDVKLRDEDFCGMFFARFSFASRTTD